MTEPKNAEAKKIHHRIFSMSGTEINQLLSYRPSLLQRLQETIWDEYCAAHMSDNDVIDACHPRKK